MARIAKHFLSALYNNEKIFNRKAYKMSETDI